MGTSATRPRWSAKTSAARLPPLWPKSGRSSQSTMWNAGAGAVPRPRVIQVKRGYNPGMTMFRYGREHYEEGEYVRRKDAVPGDGRDPVVRIIEDLGTVEIPCGKVDCRSNCLEYMVRSARTTEDYSLAECKLSPLVSII